MRRLRSLVGRFWVDALILAAMAGLLSIAARAPDPNGALGPPWVDLLIALGFTVPLLFRHRLPMGAPLLAIAVVSARLLRRCGFLDNAFPAYLMALGIAVWFGMRPNRRDAIAGVVALQVVSVVITTERLRKPNSISDYFWSLVTFTIAWIIGFALGEKASGRPT